MIRSVGGFAVQSGTLCFSRKRGQAELRESASAFEPTAAGTPVASKRRLRPETVGREFHPLVCTERTRSLRTEPQGLQLGIGNRLVHTTDPAVRKHDGSGS